MSGEDSAHLNAGLFYCILKLVILKNVTSGVGGGSFKVTSSKTPIVTPQSLVLDRVRVRVRIRVRVRVKIRIRVRVRVRVRGRRRASDGVRIRARARARARVKVRARDS